MKPLEQSKPSKPSKPKSMQTIEAVSQIGSVNLVEQSKPSKPCKPFGSLKIICIGNKVLIQNPFLGNKILLILYYLTDFVPRCLSMFNSS